jgi:hypothetical protein
MSGGPTRARRISLAGLAVGGLLLAPAVANATTRFAAPGGTATAADCTVPANPCTIFEAAQGTGVTGADEVVIAPGNYSDSTGDLGPSGFVQPVAGNLHGATGEPRPVITLDIPGSTSGAFFLSGTLSDVEIDTAVSRTNYVVFTGGLAQRVIARSSSTAAQTIACSHDGGTIRDSVCLTSGDGAAALGASLGGGVGTMNLTLRNVTAVSTGANSFGASYRFFGGASANWIVNSRSVIARGTSKDVVAGALLFSGTCPNTTVSLDFSDYATTQTQSDACGGVAAVSPAGSGSNQTAAPLVDADGFHQLAGSITVDHGFTDGSSGTSDIDGQARMIGSAPDIGADELASPTSTAVSCTPNPLVFQTGPAQCAVTVTDTTSPPPINLLSGVRLTSDMPGSFVANCETLFMATPTQGTCTAPYTPNVTGAHTITAVYPGDATHDSSQNTDLLRVTQPATPPGAGPPSNPGQARKKCKKKKKHRAAAAKKKCKKKKR